MKKKVLSLIMVAVMGLGLVACGNKVSETEELFQRFSISRW